MSFIFTTCVFLFNPVINVSNPEYKNERMQGWRNSFYQETQIVVNDSSIFSNWTVINQTKVWCTGNGTLTNPYEIAGVNVTYAITIYDSRSHFRIRNCTAASIAIYSTGISFKIQNCTINATHPTLSGILLSNAENGKLIENVVINGSRPAITLMNSQFIQIESSSMLNCSHGIMVISSSNNYFHNCTLESNTAAGISQSDSYNNTISDNEINYNCYGI
ncbi:MAG: right-handed parallel beta-helix repeat-containing protein, partial [Candidatus Hodarchaeota archaeon]